MKTSELTGAALDWAVEKCEGINLEMHYALGGKEWRPSTDWAQGGPIIERENICLRGIEGGFHAWYHQQPPKTFGPTMLIAAMRCFVASKLGEEVEVPDELL